MAAVLLAHCSTPEAVSAQTPATGATAGVAVLAALDAVGPRHSQEVAAGPTLPSVSGPGRWTKRRARPEPARVEWEWDPGPPDEPGDGGGPGQPTSQPAGPFAGPSASTVRFAEDSEGSESDRPHFVYLAEIDVHEERPGRQSDRRADTEATDEAQTQQTQQTATRGREQQDLTLVDDEGIRPPAEEPSGQAPLGEGRTAAAEDGLPVDALLDDEGLDDGGVEQRSVPVSLESDSDLKPESRDGDCSACLCPGLGGGAVGGAAHGGATVDGRQGATHDALPRGHGLPHHPEATPGTT